MYLHNSDFPPKKVLHLLVAFRYLYINCNCSLHSLCQTQLPWSLIINWRKYFRALNKNYNAVRMLKNDKAAGGESEMGDILKYRSILLAERMYSLLNL